MHELPLITIFWSRVGWFANDIHEWRSHDWKSVANHLTSDQKIIIHGNEWFILFRTRNFLSWTHCSTHFAIVAKEGLFWLNIVTSREREALALWRHIRRLFLHTQIDAKTIFTSE